MSDLFQRVVEATVKMEGRTGQGVLIPGGYIVTAAHCIEWNGEGPMALGDTFLEWVATKNGKRFRAEVIAVEAVSDIAVLGAPDNQEPDLTEDSDAFEEWTEATTPVPLALKPPLPQQSVKTRLLTHREQWINATITNHSFSGLSCGCMAIRAAEPILGGTSGGPVVDLRGRLMGVVSWASEVKAGSPCRGQIPIACRTLPPWVLLNVDPKFRAQARAQNRKIMKAMLWKKRRTP